MVCRCVACISRLLLGFAVEMHKAAQRAAVGETDTGTRSDPIRVITLTIRTLAATASVQPPTELAFAGNMRSSPADWMCSMFPETGFRHRNTKVWLEWKAQLQGN